MVKHSSRIELSKSALKKNINFIRKKVGPHPRISSVVKANAYGHGIDQFVKIAESAGVDHFAVSSSFEAEEVVEAKANGSAVMIMGILYPEDLEWVIENEIEFFVFDTDRLKRAIEVSKKVGKKAKVHLEVETGTNRTGLSEPEFKKALTMIKTNTDQIDFYGLCTHLGGAESFANQFKIDRQKIKYNEIKKICKKRKLEPRYYHIACSASALAAPDTIMDMVRIGIAQYGFWPSPEIYYNHLQTADKKKDNPLHRVLSWKTDVMDIKTVKKDEFIGYGTSFQAYKDMDIAVLPLGYCNGYSRNLSNKGFVLIDGKKSPIVGLVNMNLFMVDVSHIPEVKIGDEVVLIGKQKHNTITVSSFSNSAGLINNEMLARLPSAIPRRIVR